MVVFSKYSGWSYEKEYRFFARLDECIKIEENYFRRLQPDLVLKKVIIGPMNPYLKKQSYVEDAKYLLGLVKAYNSEILIARAEFGDYRFVRDGFWTPRFENLLSNIDVPSTRHNP